MLCIDGFNLRHRKLQENQGFFSSLMPTNLLRGSKNKPKPISSINDAYRVSEREFEIILRDEKLGYGKTKKVRYRAQLPDHCSEILAKLKFLRQGQAIGGNQRRIPGGTFTA